MLYGTVVWYHYTFWREFVSLLIFVFYIINPRANGAKRRSGRKPVARVTNSARLFTPG